MITSTNNKPYSADVQLSLRANGQEYSLAKVGPERVVLQDSVSLPPTDANA